MSKYHLLYCYQHHLLLQLQHPLQHLSQQLPQRRLLLRGDGRLLQRPTGTCQQPAAEALMQLQQAGRSAGQAAGATQVRFRHVFRNKRWTS